MFPLSFKGHVSVPTICPLLLSASSPIITFTLQVPCMMKHTDTHKSISKSFKAQKAANCRNDPDRVVVIGLK